MPAAQAACSAHRLPRHLPVVRPPAFPGSAKKRSRDYRRRLSEVRSQRPMEKSARALVLPAGTSKRGFAVRCHRLGNAYSRPRCGPSLPAWHGTFPTNGWSRQNFPVVNSSSDWASEQHALVPARPNGWVEAHRRSHADADPHRELRWRWMASRFSRCPTSISLFVSAEYLTECVESWPIARSRPHRIDRRRHHRSRAETETPTTAWDIPMRKIDFRLPAKIAASKSSCRWASHGDLHRLGNHWTAGSISTKSSQPPRRISSCATKNHVVAVGDTPIANRRTADPLCEISAACMTNPVSFDTVMHNPDSLPRRPVHRADLILAGHTTEARSRCPSSATADRPFLYAAGLSSQQVTHIRQPRSRWGSHRPWRVPREAGDFRVSLLAAGRERKQ